MACRGSTTRTRKARAGSPRRSVWPRNSRKGRRSSSCWATTFSRRGSRAASNFKKQKKGARLFLKEVDHPWEYGIAEIQGEKIKRIIEKPKRPPTNLAVIGVYMYPGDVFKIVKTLKPSKRGELEITDVNNAYIRRGGLEYEVVNGWWMDAGENHESLLQANITVARTAGVKI